MALQFKDRKDAGERLAVALERFRSEDPVVFGLPRGGVVVAAEVARSLGAPLDIVVARKIGHPGNEEYAIGAVTDDGEAVFNERDAKFVPKEWLEKETAREREEAVRRRALYAGGRGTTDLTGKTAILVDDGIATGHTVRAAVRALRKRNPARLVVAAPVAPARSVRSLAEGADEVVVLERPDEFFAISMFYTEFEPVSDSEVVALMREFAG